MSMLQLGLIGIVGETARVGHHAGINTNGRVPIQIVETTRTTDIAEHQFGGRRDLRTRNRGRSERLGKFMMIDKHALCRKSVESLTHLSSSAQSIQIEEENQIAGLQSATTRPNQK